MAKLTREELRLSELLAGSGAIDPEALADCQAAICAARSAGQRVELGAFLVSRGLVSVSTVWELLGAPDPSGRDDPTEEDRPPLPETPPSPPEDAKTDSGSSSRGKGSRRVARRSSRTRARSGRQEKARSGQRAARSGRADRQRSGRADRQRSARQSKRVSQRRSPAEESAGPFENSLPAAGLPGPGGPAAEPPVADSAPFEASAGPFEDTLLPERRSDESAVLSPDRAPPANGPLGPFEHTQPSAGSALPAEIPAELLEASDPPEAETKRFDLNALAAASHRRPRRSPLRFLPALLGAGLVLGVGLALVLPREDDPPGRDPTPTPTPSDASPEELFGELAPVASDVQPQAETLEDRFGGLERLEEEEQYAAALELLATLSEEERSRPEARQLRSRLESLESYREQADTLLAEVEGLRRSEEGSSLARRKRLERALSRLELFLATDETLRSSPAGRRLDELLLELSLEHEEREPEPPPAQPSASDEPPARAERFRAIARRGKLVLQAIRKAIKDEVARGRRVQEEEVARARKLTERRRLKVELIPGFVLEGAMVVGLDERGFTLRAQGDDLSYAWDSVDPELALAIRRIPVRDDTAEDHLRLANWCLKQRLFEEARAAYAKAVLLDARLKGQVPDVTAIARASRIFRGRLDRRGNLVSVSYGFTRQSENGDWSALGSAKGGVDAKAGRLELQGQGIYLSALKAVGFEDRIEVQGTVGATSQNASAMIGFGFQVGTRSEESYLVAARPETRELLLVRRSGGGRVEILARKKNAFRGQPRLQLDIREGKLRVRLKRRVVFRHTLGDPSWERTRVLVGGASTSPGRACIDQLVVRGKVRRAWLRKAFGEFDALLRGLLARAEDLQVFAQPDGKRVVHPLSAEDGFGMRGVSERALTEYRRGRVRAALDTPLDLLAAANAFAKVLELQPEFAAAHYRRGLVLEALGRPKRALEALQRAQSLCPHFYEAMAAEARILAEEEELDAAEGKAGQALAVRADYAPTHEALARVAYQRGLLEEALGHLDPALALDPWDERVRAFRRNVSHVLKGPPWERTHTRVTEHYIVKTDISQSRCAEYAEELEVIRGFYTRLFGDARGSRRKAVVLIFDTAEGFHSYAELTTDDRVESLLGYYLPRYRQLLLYEDKADASLEETKRVLYHEAFHQFIEGIIPDMPFWLNEGFADYFSGSEIDGGRVTRQAGVLEARLRDLRRLVKRSGPVPFPRLMQETPAQFYSGPVAAKYAQAWSMVHFFRHGAPEPVRERFVRYVQLLREGQPARQAFRTAWGSASWDAVQRAWWAHVQKM